MALGTPVRRNSRDSGCQWLAIGMALGVGCSLVFCLASYIAGFIEVPGLENETAVTAAPVVVVPQEITATPLPTDPPTEAVEEADAVEAAGGGEEAPTAEGDDIVQSATPLGSGASPTPLGEAPTGQATLAESAANTESQEDDDEVVEFATPVPEDDTEEDVGTPVPLSGEPTRTPQGLGLPPDAPNELVTIASPMVEIPGGTFMMGTTREEGLQAVENCVTRDLGTCTESYIQDSTPAHEVTLTDFQIELYEVSAQQYVTFLNTQSANAPEGVRFDRAGCSGQACVITTAEQSNSIIRYNGEGYELVNSEFYNNHPIFFVTWWGADAYCKSLGRRLPTEAEWERAARGPANSIYPWGPEWVPTNANTSRSTDAGQGTLPIDSYPSGSSAYGPFNLAGNVSEWVFDFYQENYYSQPEASGPDPTGPVSSNLRVVRGGGWDNVPLFSRTVHRMYAEPSQGSPSRGFRCAADIGVQ